MEASRLFLAPKSPTLYLLLESLEMSAHESVLPNAPMYVREWINIHADSHTLQPSLESRNDFCCIKIANI
jgi:hypothetical protein